tara:strand:+ start:1814 stop:2005 length:192 start_codon:yes stop_codon:yes gene_type:complete
MGYMKHLYLLLQDGASVEDIAAWLIKVNMERNSHNSGAVITHNEALILAKQYYNDYNEVNKNG